jgi:DNA primase
MATDMAYSDDDKRRVLDATDIVALIGEHAALKRVGRRWSGLCPFHAENSPSLSVNAEEGLYYCFGCQAKGDALSFVMAVYRLSFQEALEHLAGRAGIRMTPISGDNGEARSQRERSLDLLTYAQGIFKDALSDPLVGKAARQYLSDRQISAEAIKYFAIGYAPQEGRSLVDQLRAKPEELVAAGLGYLDDRGRFHDHFRGRVTFPISETSGRIVAFGGRILPEIAEAYKGASPLPKYKNSPETAVYHKRRTLYGLDLARSEIVRSTEIVICEGYTDVIGMWQSGVHNAVATCGTALTEDHFDRLKNFAKRVVLAFDADGAGQDAAERFYLMEQRHNLQIAVAQLPFGKDPAEVAAVNPEALREAVMAAEPFLSFRLRRLFSRSDLTTSEGRARAAGDAIAMVVEHPNPLVRSDYVGLIADRTRLQVSELKRRIESSPHSRRSRLVAHESMQSLAQHDSEADRAAEEAMRLLVHDPQELSDVIVPDLFRSSNYRELAVIVGHSRSLSEAAVTLSQLGDKVSELFYRLASEPSSIDPFDVISTFVVQEAKIELSLLSQRLRRGGSGSDLAALSGDVTRVSLLLQQLGEGKGGEAIGELIAWIVGHRSKKDDAAWA